MHESHTEGLPTINQFLFVTVYLQFAGVWGRPGFSTPIFIAMLTGVVSSIVESIGDYYTCARLAGAPQPPVHAVNRGEKPLSYQQQFESQYDNGLTVKSTLVLLRNYPK